MNEREPSRPGSDAGNDKDASKESLDLLIEQSRRMLEIYNARQSNADTKTAAIVTAAVALGTITVSASESVRDANNTLAETALVFGVLSVFVAFLARLSFGLYYRRKMSRPGVTDVLARKRIPLLSTESQAFQDAHRELLRSGGDSDPDQVRVLTLAMWRAREADSRHMARAKDRGAGAAATLLAAALICDTILGIQLIH